MPARASMASNLLGNRVAPVRAHEHPKAAWYVGSRAFAASGWGLGRPIGLGKATGSGMVF